MKNKVLIISASDEMSFGFAELVENLQNRISAAEIAESCSSEEGIYQHLCSIVEEDITDILLIPVGIPRSDNFMVALNNAISRFIEENPEMNLKVINRFLSASSLEDDIWEVITAEYTDSSLLPQQGKNIETLSHLIIDKKLQSIKNFSLKEKVVARRIIHATADYSFAHTLSFSYGAVDAGIKALQEQKPVICDVNMLKTAMTHIDTEIICAIKDPEVIALAKENKSTRAAAAMLSLKDRLDGAIVAVGNAPTAIWQLLEMDVKPALVVGLPVGFVGARESKLALTDSEFTSIANSTPRGGSPAAAAALNAIALLAKKS